MTVNLVGQLQAAAAPGQQHLDGATIRRLRELTGLLIAARPGADGDLARHEGRSDVRARRSVFAETNLNQRAHAGRRGSSFRRSTQFVAVRARPTD
jgi:hypothetical protein